MKRNHGLLGAAAFLLAAMFLFAGCPTEADSSPGDPGIKAPSPGSLPDLPSEGGVSAAATTDEAETLLEALQTANIGGGIQFAVQDVIYDNMHEDEDEEGYTYEFTDEEADGVKVSGKGSMTFEGDLDPEAETFTVNASLNYSSKDNWKATVTEDATVSDFIVLENSVFEYKKESSSTMKVTAAGDAETAKFNMSQSGTEQYAFGLTVKSGDKAAKIILDAKSIFSASVSNKTFDEMEEEGESSQTYSGSLKVYGANNAVIKTITITDRTSWEEALGYFGLGDDDGSH
jgi:hypothetical protein